MSARSSVAQATHLLVPPYACISFSFSEKVFSSALYDRSDLPRRHVWPEHRKEMPQQTGSVPLSPQPFFARERDRAAVAQNMHPQEKRDAEQEQRGYAQERAQGIEDRHRATEAKDQNNELVTNRTANREKRKRRACQRTPPAC